MKKVLSVFGTRPEAIKMAPVVKELELRREIKSIVCVTAQHREMLDQVLEVFGIHPDYDLNIMKEGQTLGYITAEVLTALNRIIEKERPDLVLVHGDTTSAMAAALAAYYRNIAVGHVEAGLRTYDINSPFPEEINRQIIDKISRLLFAPTYLNKEYLQKDCNKGQMIFVTGNTVVDALKTTVIEGYSCDDFDWVKNHRMILLTMHRRENFGKPMENIFAVINKITDEFDDVRVIYPVHPNPEVRNVAKRMFDGNKKIRLINPLDVIEFHNYMEKAYLIMSDSGGVQEEASALHKPVLVLRKETERPEGVNAGTLKLVGTSFDEVLKEVRRLLVDDREYKKMIGGTNPYGDGNASKRIVDAIEKYG